jgi:hypothetical protein
MRRRVTNKLKKTQKLSADHHRKVAFAQGAPAPERRKVDGIPYVADMTLSERAETDRYRFVGIDPGRRDLLHMISDEGKDGNRRNLKYSNRKHVHVSGRARLTKKAKGMSNDRPLPVVGDEA